MANKIHNPEADIIINKMPPFAIRYGVIAIFFVITGFFLLCNFIQYPQVYTYNVVFCKQTSLRESVLTTDSAVIYGKFTITADDYVKIYGVKDLKIELTAYPQNKYGMIEGKINFAKYCSENGEYEVYVFLPNGFVTESLYKIPYLEGLTGTGSVTVGHVALFEYITKYLLSMFNR